MGDLHTCAITTDRSLWCWGYNPYGQLGLGDKVTRLVPTQVSPGTQWAMVEAGEEFTCAIQSDRTLWCWGVNAKGNLGLPDHRDRDAPTKVGTASNWATVSLSFFYGCGLRVTHTLWCWGYNQKGQLGLPGRPGAKNRPTRVGGHTHWTQETTGGEHTCAIQMDRSLWCWGLDDEGQLGLGDHKNRWVPRQVGDATDWLTISAATNSTFGRRPDGQLWSWGANESGELGLGDRRPHLIPVQVQHPRAQAPTGSLVAEKANQHRVPESDIWRALEVPCGASAWTTTSRC